MTEWFTNLGNGVAVHQEDPGMILVGNYVPDWVEMPAESPESAGQKFRVVGYRYAICPMCKSRQVRHLKLDSDYGVAQCVPAGPDRCGFVFYRM